MSGYWYLPLDEECPKVKEFYDAVMSDPMTAASGMGGEILAQWERKHRAECERCQEYGAANIEAVY